MDATELTLRGRRLVVERLLGSGATSSVWLAREGGRRYALKVGKGRALRPRFAEECARLAWVGSDSLIEVVDGGLLREGVRFPDGSMAETGSPCLLLDFVDGDALEPGAPRSAADAMTLALVVARDIGRALGDLHAAGLAHGDVKPANILLERDDGGAPRRARLVDFGLATEGTEVVPRGGTRRYLAPELLEAAGDARARDLYAFGLVLAEILSEEFRHAERPAELSATVLPGELGARVAVLLSPAPGARPQADWLERHARRWLGSEESQAERFERRRRAVRRAYLATRREEILALSRVLEPELLVTGEPRAWLESALELGRAVIELGSDGVGVAHGELGDLTPYGRSRWLVTLVGPSAAAWPDGGASSDAELAARLFAALNEREPASLVYADLAGGAAPGTGAASESDLVALALALEGGAVDAQLFDEGERVVDEGAGSKAFVLALARALARRAQYGRALAVLAKSAAPEALAETAELFRRIGDAASAEERASQVLAQPAPPAARARAVATLGRLRLDRGAADEAEALLAREPDSAPVLEIRALAALARAEFKLAFDFTGRAASLAVGDDARARVEAVRGNIAHATGDAEAALRAFRSAAEHAARAGAVLEEATYLTGVAASGTQLGELGTANAAAQRAVLLFEALGRRVEAARAMLAVASSHAATGAGTEAREAALEAAQRARATGDRRCAGFAHLVLADLLEAPHREGLEHARFAASQLPANGDDALRAAARLWIHGEANVELSRFDALGSSAESSVEARLEWWGARAEVEARRAVPDRPELVAASLAALASGPVVARGPALAAGARLAARTGDGSMTRRLTRAAGDAAREILRRAPVELRAALGTLPWVRAAEAADTDSAFSSEQVGDVETLVRALGRRDELRSLLRQVVDALVLWTGIERGLL
ncbi:MAG TPA: protein kinase, partial [Polyangiaceae bacterium]|nr:protein kinase [Polyangiaceae bacterium]